MSSDIARAVLNQAAASQREGRAVTADELDSRGEGRGRPALSLFHSKLDLANT